MPIYGPDGNRDYRAEYRQAAKRQTAADLEVKRAYGRARQRALNAMAAAHPDTYSIYFDAEKALEPLLAPTTRKAQP